jgi:hypothetical protein
LPKSVNFRVIFPGGNMTPISGNVIKNQNMTLSATLPWPPDYHHASLRHRASLYSYSLAILYGY